MPGTNTGSNAWMNNFISSLQQHNAQQSAQDDASVRALLDSLSSGPVNQNSSPAISFDQAMNITGERDYSLPTNYVAKAADVAMRPLKATAQTIAATAAQLPGFNKEKAHEEGIETNPFKAFWQGISGENPDEWSDILRKAGAPDVVSGLFGTAGDIVLDPLNFIPIGKIAQGAKGLTKAGRAAKALDKAEDLAEADRVFNEVLSGQQSTADSALKEMQDAVKNQRTVNVQQPDLNKVLESWNSPDNEFNSFVAPEVPTSTGPITDFQSSVLDKYGPNVKGPIELPDGSIYPNFNMESVPNNLAPAGTTFDEVSAEASRRSFQGELGPENRKAQELLNKMGSTEEAQDFVAGLRRNQTKPTIKPSNKTARITHDDMDSRAKIEALLNKSEELESQLDQMGATLKESGSLENINRAEQLSKDVVPKDPHTLAVGNSARVWEIIKQEAKATRSEGLTHGPQNIEIYRRAIPRIVQADENAIAAGNFPHITTGTNKPSWPLTYKQMMDFVDNHGVESFTDKGVPVSPSIRAFIRFQSAIPTADIQAMFARTMELADVPITKEFTQTNLREAIKNAGKEHTKNTPYSWNEADLNNPIVKEISLDGPRNIRKIEEAAGGLATILAAHKNELKELVQSNMAGLAAKDVATGKEIGAILSEAVKSDFDLTAKGSVSEAVKDVTNPSKLVDEVTAGNDTAALAAKERVGKTVSDLSTPEDIKFAKVVKSNVDDFEKGSAKEAVNNARQRNLQEAKLSKEETTRDIEKATGRLADEFEDRLWAETQNTILRKRNVLKGMLQRFGKDAGEFGIDYKNRTTFGMSLHNRFREELGKLKNAHDPAALKRAYKAIQDGKTFVPNEAINNAVQDLLPLVKTMFDLDDPLYNVLFRNGYSRADIEKFVKRTVFEYEDIPKEVFEQGQEAVNKWVADSWRKQIVDDPLDYLERVHKGIVDLNTYDGVGTSASRYAVTKVPEGAAEAGLEYVKVPKNLKETRIMQHIPTESNGKELLYPKQVIDQIAQLDRELNISTRGGDSFFSKHIVQGLVDPFLAIFKPLVTIVNPQHLERNLLSDLYLNYMGGIKTLTPYKKAVRALQAGGHFDRTMEAAVNGLFKPTDLNKYNRISVPTRSGPVEINMQEVFKMMEEDGVLPGFHQTEDIFERAGNDNKLWRFTKKVQRSKPVQIGASISEKTTHIMRATQYIHELEKGGKNLKAIRLKASETSRRYHPDTMGLSPEAMRYARRIIPFYSWFRQTMPIIFETAVTKPARLTALNKVMYGAQTALGNANDPETSINNPYPVNREIPSFMKDHIAYAGGNLTFNFGTPMEALGDIVNGNMPRNILGMMNPLLKAPVELATGNNIAFGTEISDWSDWTDSQIPVVSKIAQISGYSPSGTLANIGLGEHTEGPGPLDPTRSLARGNKDAFFNTSLYNFFTGIGMQRIDTPTNQRIARRENTYEYRSR